MTLYFGTAHVSGVRRISKIEGCGWEKGWGKKIIYFPY